MEKFVNFYTFCDSFGESHKNNFSYEGKQALYDYLLEYEEETGTELELDPIAYCCEYTEYKDLKELQADYQDIETMEELGEKTIVIPVNNINGEKTDAFIIQQF